VTSKSILPSPERTERYPHAKVQIDSQHRQNERQREQRRHDHRDEFAPMSGRGHWRGFRLDERSFISGLRDGGQQLVARNGRPGVNRGFLGREIDGHGFHARHLGERLFDAAYARGTGHPANSKFSRVRRNSHVLTCTSRHKSFPFHCGP